MAKENTNWMEREGDGKMKLSEHISRMRATSTNRRVE
jgi:hypothetical protein